MMSEMAFLSLIGLTYIFLWSIGSSHPTPAITIRTRSENNRNTFDKHLIVLGSSDLLRPVTKSVTEETKSKSNNPL